MRRRSSWPIPCQAASSYADSAGQELLSMLRPHADAASTSWEAREDLGQGSNFESFLPVRSRLAPTHRWLVAIGQERVQERLCKGPASTCDRCSSSTDLADLGRQIRKPQPG